MGGGRIFLKTYRASLCNHLSNEPNFGRIHLAGPSQNRLDRGHINYGKNEFLSLNPCTFLG
jgi:hypothetical protein